MREGRAAGLVRPLGALGRRRLRLPRPGRHRPWPRCAARRSAWPAWPPRSRPDARRWTRSCTTSATPSRPAPPRSTWSSTAARSWPATTSRLFDEIVATKAACGSAHLKVILETGELATLDNARRASWLALLAGGDFIKTSTGKIAPAATPPVALVMLEAVRDYYAADRRAARRQAGRRHPHVQGGRALPGDGERGRRRAMARSPTCSASVPPACSTTCCCSATRLATGELRRPRLCDGGLMANKPVSSTHRRPSRATSPGSSRATRSSSTASSATAPARP